MKAASLVVMAVAGCGSGSLDTISSPSLMVQPNVVVIMADDLDDGLMETMIALDLAPNIETYLYGGGTRFRQSFVSNSICCPSRATMLTGQYSHNNGVHGIVPQLEHGGVDALDDTSTLATWLQAAGYRTGHIGKYLNGYGLEVDDTTPSFQPEYVPPGWDHWQATIGSGTYKMFDYSINDTRDGVQTIAAYGGAVADYQTTVLAQRATEFIDQAVDRGGPFFLEVMPVAPHAESHSHKLSRWDYFIRSDPQDAIDKPEKLAMVYSLMPPSLGQPSFDYVAPSQPNFIRNRPALSETDVEDIVSFYRDRMAAMLAVDDLVGDVVARLSDRGVLDNTVIIFTSDNGWLEGHHRAIAKRVAYEESIRVPLYIRHPLRYRAIVDRLVVNADLAPTIAELAGADPTLVVDGRSLVGFLDETVPTGAWRRRVLLESWNEPMSVTPTYVGIRTVRYLFVDYYEAANPMRELYDLDVDPYQINSVQADPAYRRTKWLLRRQLDALRSCAGPACRAAEE
jgi:N-acetylglucosamine-6-sulfatase